MDVTPELIEERRRLGIDTFDEVWDGEYRVNPFPVTAHQRVTTDLLVSLRPHLLERQHGELLLGLNVIEAAEGWFNFRCPDLVFIAAARAGIVSRDGIRAAGPDTVFEVRSPGDDTYRKLPFYSRLGVRDVVVIHRDTKRPEVFRCAGGAFEAAAPDDQGWIRAETMGMAFRWVEGERPAVEVRDDEGRAVARI